MSGTRTLVYKQSPVEVMVTDIDSLRTALKATLETTFINVDGQLTGWNSATLSRQSERTYQQQLRASIDDALAALERLSTALTSAAELADTAETQTSRCSPDRSALLSARCCTRLTGTRGRLRF